MPYEPGMQIIFDVVGKRAMIIFRGNIIDLPGPFPTQAAAISAGEKRCRELGWIDRSAEKKVDGLE
ncbi:MAG: hypothetical protein DI604_34180 [Delftia acidovorans]|nr:MAG: hypothetical protein DI604_34180 [Delftia acidovorans]